MPDRPDLFDDLFGLPDDEFSGMPRHTARATRAARHPMPCPPLGILLAYANEHDTSLTPRRRLRIREHVHCCETCFTHVERAYEEVLHGVAEMLKESYDFNQAVIRRRDSRFQEALHAQVKLTAPPLGSHYPITRWLSIAATPRGHRHGPHAGASRRRRDSRRRIDRARDGVRARAPR